MRMAVKRECNPRESLFVQEMIKNGFVAYPAAIKAGYAVSTAGNQSHLIAARPHVKEHLDDAKRLLKTQRIEEAEKILEQNVNILNRIIKDLTPEDGKINRQDVKGITEAVKELNKLFGLHAPVLSERKSVTINMTAERIKESKKVYDEY